MSFSFNLIDQPWIPCLREDGSPDELSIQDILMQAHTLREIRGDTPLETAVLHRLLLTILHRVFGPKDRQAWLSLWNRKDTGFDDKLIETYIKTWKHKFDLFDPAFPFFQVADQKQLGKEDTVNKMVMQLTTDSTLFQHTLNSLSGGAELSCAQAARALITVQSYALGYQLFVDGPCSKSIVFLVLGNTLFETLVLNLSRYPEEDGDYQSTSDDAPAWETESPFKVSLDGNSISRDVSMVNGKQRYEEHTPLGQLDYLTWHNRKIKLIPEMTSKGVIVRKIAWAPGMRLKGDVADPMQTYFKTDNLGYVAMPLNPDRALWRDSETLLRMADDGQGFRLIKSVKWLSLISVSHPEVLPQTLRLTAFGSVKNRASLDFIRAESFPLPVEFLENKDHVSNLRSALELAEKTGKLLNRSAFLLAWMIRSSTTSDKNFDDTDKSFDEQSKIDGKIALGKNDRSRDREAQQIYQLFSSFGVERIYWSQLEIHFHRMIQDLPSQSDRAKDQWRNQLKRVANAAFTQAILYAGADLRAQRAIVKAEEQFQFGMTRLLNVQKHDSANGGKTHDTN